MKVCSLFAGSLSSRATSWTPFAPSLSATASRAGRPSSSPLGWATSTRSSIPSFTPSSISSSARPSSASSSALIDSLVMSDVCVFGVFFISFGLIIIYFLKKGEYILTVPSNNTQRINISICLQINQKIYKQMYIIIIFGETYII